MKYLKSYYSVILFLALTANTWASLSPQVTGYLVKTNPSLYGAEVQFSLLMEPFQKKSFLFGPRVGVIGAYGSGQNRYDFQVGAEGTLWFVNALGAGLGLDFIPVSWMHTSAFGTQTRSPHLQINPYLSARLYRFQCSGAWAIRTGVIYDTLYQWGINLGMSLQFSGVFNLADMTCSGQDSR